MNPRLNRHDLGSIEKGIIFIDTSVTDYQSLVEGTEAEYKVFLLSPTRDGIEQITAALSKYKEIATVHIVSHGSPGCWRC